ncbi:MAG: IS200/IS605 family transposase [Janthinobacterium lividum]
MAHIYHRNFTHLVWTTWDRAPLLKGNIEQEAYALIQSQCARMKVTMYALGGVSDHVHLLVSLPRTLCLADFMEAVKGVSSRVLNDTHGSQTWAFKWQGGYSDHSVSPPQVALIKHYIENQKSHHANHLLWPSSEPEPKLSLTKSDAREGGELHF